MKKCKRGKYLLAALPLLLILAWPLYRLGAFAVRELSFYLNAPSETEILVHNFAKENGLLYSDYPQELISLLERNPETETFVLEYPTKKDLRNPIDLTAYLHTDAVPLFLQWDQQWGYLPYGDGITALTGCGPMCLSMAAVYLTGSEEYAPDKILAFAAENGFYAPGYGSSWTLISEGGPKLGLDVKELPLVKKKVFDQLEAGNPVICVMGPGDFTTTGHFIVMVGCEDGMIRVNDPNSTVNSEKLWSFDAIQGQIRNLWAISN